MGGRRRRCPVSARVWMGVVSAIAPAYASESWGASHFVVFIVEYFPLIIMDPFSAIISLETETGGPKWTWQARRSVGRTCQS